METLQLKVTGMSCKGCVMAVQGALTRVAGVQSVAVDLEGGSATVEYDPEQTSPEALIAAVTQVGYGARLPQAA